MKTKFKYFSLAIAALLMVGFASCSSDDEPKTGNENETISVVLKIAVIIIKESILLILLKFFYHIISHEFI